MKFMISFSALAIYSLISTFLSTSLNGPSIGCGLVSATKSEKAVTPMHPSNAVIPALANIEKTYGKVYAGQDLPITIVGVKNEKSSANSKYRIHFEDMTCKLQVFFDTGKKGEQKFELLNSYNVSAAEENAFLLKLDQKKVMKHFTNTGKAGNYKITLYCNDDYHFKCRSSTEVQILKEKESSSSSSSTTTSSSSTSSDTSSSDISLDFEFYTKKTKKSLHDLRQKVIAAQAKTAEKSNKATSKKQEQKDAKDKDCKKEDKKSQHQHSKSSSSSSSSSHQDKGSVETSSAKTVDVDNGDKSQKSQKSELSSGVVDRFYSLNSFFGLAITIAALCFML